ncbi:MAG: hypothetical protein RR140_00920, partial [Clostridia bacterium]
PSSVTSIERYAFNGCTALTSMTIGDAQNGSALASVLMAAFLFQNRAECTLTYYGTDEKFLGLTNYSHYSNTAFSNGMEMSKVSYNIKLVIINGNTTIDATAISNYFTYS